MGAVLATRFARRGGFRRTGSTGTVLRLPLVRAALRVTLRGSLLTLRLALRVVLSCSLLSWRVVCSLDGIAAVAVDEGADGHGLIATRVCFAVEVHAGEVGRRVVVPMGGVKGKSGQIVTKWLAVWYLWGR